MDWIVLLYVSGSLAASFTGPGATLACLEVQATYEAPAACVAPPADGVPYLALRLDASPRPRPRPAHIERGAEP